MSRYRNRKNFSLKAKIIFWIIGAGSLPLLLGMFISYAQGQKSLQKVIGSSFQALAQESARKIDFTLGEELERIKFLAHHPDIIQSIEQENATHRKLGKDLKKSFLEERALGWSKRSRQAEALILNPGSKLLRQFNKADNRLQEATRALFVSDAEGHLVSSINFYPEFSLTGKSIFIGPLAAADPFLRGIMPDKETGDHVFYIAAPIINDAGEIIGSLYRVFSVEKYFSSMLEGTRFGNTGHVMIIDSNGVVIRCPILPTGSKLGNRELVKTVTALNPGWAQTQGNGHGSQEASIIGFSPLVFANTLFKSPGASGWHTFVWQASEELFEPMNKLMLWIAVTGLGALGLIALFGVIASSRILKPIRKLREAIAKIGEGSDAEAVPVTAHDEIGKLAESFNEMTAKLRASRESERAHLAKLEETLARFKHSEERIRLIVENVVDGIITIDEQGIVQSFNPAAEKIFGYQAGEVLGKNVKILMPDPHRNQHDSYLDNYWKTRIAKVIGLSVEVTGLRKDGETVPVTLEVSELNQDNKKLFVAVLRDITERQKMENQLRKLSMAVEQSPSPVLIAGITGIIEYVNPSFCASTGYGPDEIIGKTPRILKSGIHSDRFYEKLWQKLLAGEEWRGEFCNRKKDGSLYWELQSISPLRDSAGDITHFLSVKIDDTERKRAEEQLKIYSSELERSNEALKDFASIASHDMQEPLRKILIFGDRLNERRGALDETGQNYLNRMMNAAQRMQRFIFDLLDYSRASSSGQQFEPTDLNKALEDVLTDLEMSIQQSGGSVQVDGALPVLEADKLLMRQLFQNLISNGLKFHKEGEPPKIRVSSRLTSKGFWEISFQDNGIGFEIKNLNRILKPFQRLHGRDEYEGSGMGLTICHKIIARHGGTLTAKSSPGQGATFIIRIPEKQESSKPANFEVKEKQEG